MKISEILVESWSQKYKNSINCSHPKGFSQKAHCAGKKKHNESIDMEMTCPDCGMCESHGTLNEIKKGQKDSNGFTKCWPGKHAEGTKKGKNGGQVRNCVPNESVEEAKSAHPKQAAIAISKKKTNEDLDADQKRVGQVGAKEKAKKISPVLTSSPKKHPYNNRLVGEATDPKFIGFMNKALGDKADPKPTTTKLPAEYSKFGIMSFDNMPGYTPAFKFGLNVLKAMDQNTRQHFINAPDDDLIVYMLNIADKKGFMPKHFVEEDLDEVTQWFDEIFADPSLESWTDLLKSMSGKPGLQEEHDDITEIVNMPPVKKRMDIASIFSTIQDKLRYHEASELTSINFPIKNRVFRDGNDVIKFFLFQNNVPIFYLGISKFHDGFKTGAVAGSAEMQGQGLGWKLYKAVSEYLQVPLYSDSTQTVDSKTAIWQRLINNFPNQVVGYDQLTRKNVAINDKIYQTLPNDQLKDVDDATRRNTLLLKLLPTAIKKNTAGVAEANLNEFVPPNNNGGEDERSRRLRKLLEIAIQVAKEKNVDELGMIHAMNMIASDEFFNVAVEGLLPDITDREYMYVLESAYKTVKKGLSEGYGRYYCSTDKRWKERKGPKQTRRS